MEGKHGSLLKIFDKKTGQEINSTELDDMPTWDGMIFAENKIYLSTENGRVSCFELR